MNDPSLFWEKHLKAIALEGVTTRAYAEREGLAVKDLYHWRRKFKSRTLSQRSKHQPATSPGFLQVRVEPTENPAAESRWQLSAGILHLDIPAYPDVQWLAAMMKALHVAGER